MSTVGRSLAEAKLRELEALTWEELDSYGKRVEVAQAQNGRRCRVKSVAFWDMEPWESDMCVIVKVYDPPWWPVPTDKVVGGLPGEDIPPRPLG
jgi:hypothetical protein